MWIKREKQDQEENHPHLFRSAKALPTPKNQQQAAVFIR